MNKRYDFTCPYCGLKFHQFLDIKIGKNIFVVTCPDDDGGCEKSFALYSSVKVLTEDTVIQLEPPFLKQL